MTYLASDCDVLVLREMASAVRPEWDSAVPAYVSQWKTNAISHVLRLGQLENNWDSYGSPKPSHNVVETALAIINTIPFDDLPFPDVVPVSGGGIQLEWSMEGRELEIQVRADGSLEFLQSENHEPTGEGPITSVALLLSLVLWLQGTNLIGTTIGGTVSLLRSISQKIYGCVHR
jgi:hypothetical protein